MRDRTTVKSGKKRTLDGNVNVGGRFAFACVCVCGNVNVYVYAHFIEVAFAHSLNYANI